MKIWKQGLLLVFIGLFVGLLLAEVCLRLLGITYPSLYDYDPHVGDKLRPAVTGYWTDEGGGYVSINSDGLRDIERSINKPPDTLRIAVLGDSFTEAFQVNRDRAFWAVMEKELPKCKKLSKRKVEVINFGQSGLGTALELQVLRHRVWKYSPNAVVLALFTGNDIYENVKEFRTFHYHPYFVYESDELVLHDEQTKQEYREHDLWWRHFLAKALNMSRVLQVVWHGKKRIEAQVEQKQRIERAKAVNIALEPGLSYNQLSEPTSEVWKKAWRVTEGLLLKMRDEIKEKGATFFVVILSSGIQVHPDPSVRAKFERARELNDLFYAERRIEEFCRSKGIPVLALGPPFQRHASEHKVFLHGFGVGSPPESGHWNEAGHRLGGAMIAGWLCDELK